MSPSPSVQTTSQHTCQVCHRTYERIDHLNRHLDSHRNERSFKCPQCPRGFNRRDLLVRHQATHTKYADDDDENKPAERAIRACDACVKSKVKCENERPCKRCKKRGTPCTSDSLRQRGESGTVSVLTPPTPVASVSDGNVSAAAGRPSEIEGGSIDGYDPTLGASITMPDSTVRWDDVPTGSIDPNLPAFFESIMVPDFDFTSGDMSQAPPAINNVMPEIEDWLSMDDIFGTDFAPALDQVFGATAGVHPDTGVQPTAESTDGSRGPLATVDAGTRHNIFKNSPWLWKPKSSSTAFSEHNRIQISDHDVDLSASPAHDYTATVAIFDTLSSQARDRIFQLVVKTAKSQVSVPTFPSAETLELLMKVGIVKRLETDAWIHPYSFSSDTASTELLVALIAAGCVCFGNPTVNRTGLVLLEIARVALNKLVEDDNSAARSLEYLQASMIWLDVCSFCGYKRKMEMAESNLQPLVTALRRFGKLDRVAYQDIVPETTDDGLALNTKWRQWIEQESFKRLVHHLFEHDMLVTLTKQRQHVISYAELTLPLPACRDLWLAPTAEMWRDTYTATYRTTHEVQPSLRSILSNSDLSDALPSRCDRALAINMFLCGTAAQIWELEQQTALIIDSADRGDAHDELWLRARHQKLHNILERLHSQLNDVSAVGMLAYEYLLTIMHVKMDTIMRFAGKCGEHEAHIAYQDLQAWYKGKHARIAVWHAGQVVRMARSVPPYHLRGGDALLTYHAVMVLWSYGMMLKDNARRTGLNTPVQGARGLSSTNGLLSASTKPIVLLDAPPCRDSKIFLEKDVGRPCLQLDDSAGSAICQLRNPADILKLGSRLLDANCPGESRERMPQMLKSLCGLMDELGALN